MNNYFHQRQYFWRLVIAALIVPTFVVSGSVVAKEDSPKAVSSSQESNESDNSNELLDEIDKAGELLKQGKAEEAITVYKEVLDGLPDNAGVRQRLAKAYFRVGDIENAIAELEIAVRLKPQVAVYQAELAWLYTKANNMQGAMRHAKIASGLAPDIAAPYVILGYCYGLSDKFGLAYKALTKAIVLEPKNVTAHIYLAEVLEDDNKFKESIKAYKNALAIDPKNAQALLGVARVSRLKGDSKSESEYYAKVIESHPNDADVLGRYGWYLSTKGDLVNSLSYGFKATMLRINESWDQFMGMFIAVWAGIFIVFGMIFTAIAAGANFKPQPGEVLVRSFLLIMYKNKPGRLVLTNRRIVFVPELVSRSFGATRLSIERDQVLSIDSRKEKSKEVLEIGTKNGDKYLFKVPVMIQKPLLEALKKESMVKKDKESEATPEVVINKPEADSQPVKEETKEEQIVASLDFRPETADSSKKENDS